MVYNRFGPPVRGSCAPSSGNSGGQRESPNPPSGRFPKKKTAVPMAQTTKNNIGYCWIKCAPLPRKVPNIPNSITETNRARSQEVKNALNHQGKMRMNNLSVPGRMTRIKSTRPENPRNSDSIRCIGIFSVQGKLPQNWPRLVCRL